jgi:hypothetical protein
MFSCPNCAQVLGDYPDAGVLVMQCARCTFKYEVSGGRVVGLTSWKVEVRPATGEARAIHARCFELALAISARETVRFTFASERDDDWIRARMATLNSDVYADRIRAIDQALTTLDAQLDVDGRLARNTIARFRCWTSSTSRTSRRTRCQRTARASWTLDSLSCTVSRSFARRQRADWPRTPRSSACCGTRRREQDDGLTSDRPRTPPGARSRIHAPDSSAVHAGSRGYRCAASRAWHPWQMPVRRRA